MAHMNSPLRQPPPPTTLPWMPCLLRWLPRYSTHQLDERNLHSGADGHRHYDTKRNIVCPPLPGYCCFIPTNGSCLSDRRSISGHARQISLLARQSPHPHPYSATNAPSNPRNSFCVNPTSGDIATSRHPATAACTSSRTFCAASGVSANSRQRASSMRVLVMGPSSSESHTLDSLSLSGKGLMSNAGERRQ